MEIAKVRELENMVDDHREVLVTRAKDVDGKAKRFNSGVNVIVTAHSEQRMFLLPCLQSVKSIGWTLLTYDNPEGNYLKQFPSDACLKLVDQFFMKHPTKIVPGPTYPQFWNFKHGVDILMGSQADYVFVIGGDSILEKPEGIGEIVKLLGDGDIIACSTRRKNHGQAFCGTKSFLVKKTAFCKMLHFIERETFYPFKNCGNLEVRFGLAIQELKMKEVIAPEQPEEDQFAHTYDKDGNCSMENTWAKVLGYRHLGGEHKIRRVKKLKPLDEKYYDKEYLRHQETETLIKYWETKGWAHVENWWKT